MGPTCPGEQLLARLEGLVRDAGALVSGYLRPGAEPARVHDALASFGLRPPADLVTWFGWHDGSSAPRRSYPVNLETGLAHPDPDRPGTITVDAPPELGAYW